MLTLKCKIEIVTVKDNKKISFDYVHSITVNTFMDSLTDRATIQLPRNMYQGEKRLAEFIGKGDAITIYMGYEEYGLNEVFTGYITKTENQITKDKRLLILYCENEMYKLDSMKMAEAQDIEKFDIKTFVEKAGISCKIVGDFSFGCVSIEQGQTIADVLSFIHLNYPYIECYFQNDTLYIVEDGKLEDPNRNSIVFDPSRNMISDNLTLVEESKDICLIATTVNDFNERIQAANKNAAEEKDDGYGGIMLVSKKDYEERHRYCPQFKTKEDLQKYVDSMYDRLTATRMTGDFTAFGVPFVRKGDIVELRDEDRPERNKRKFIVQRVNYSLSTDLKKDAGYRQTITLGQEIE